MNAQQAENLRILIRHMETKVTRTLDMGRVAHECGTPGCAIGEATTIPALGLSLPKNPACRGAFLIVRGGLVDYEAAAYFVFGMGARAQRRIFGCAIENGWDRNDVTSQEWTVEAREVLAEHGYSMDDAAPAKVADDGFSAFLAKVREPVELEVAAERP